MKTEKNHIYLSTKERNEIVTSLIKLKNKLIEQSRYTELVDKIIVKLQKQSQYEGNSIFLQLF